MKQALLKLKFPPCQGCSGTASPTASGHGALWAHRSTPGKCFLPGLTGQPQSQPRMLLQTNSSDRWTAWLGHNLVSVWEKVVGLPCLCSASVSSYILLYPLTCAWWNNPPCSAAAAFMLALSILFSAERDLSSVSGQCHSLELRREKRQIQVLSSYRWMPAYHKLVAVLSPSPPTPLVLSVCLLLFFLWGIVNITASQSLALSKVPRCIIHEFGNKRSLFWIPLSLMNFHRWISGLFGWLKLKFELLKLQGGALELLCQEGWGRQHFIFSLIRTSL